MAKSTKTSAPAAKSPVAAEVKRSQTGPFTAPLTGKIHIVNKAPKAAGTGGGKRYALYREGMTVQQYLDASTKAGNRLGLAKADVMWDFNHEFITISGFSLKPLGAPARGRGPAAEVKAPVTKKSARKSAPAQATA